MRSSGAVVVWAVVFLAAACDPGSNSGDDGSSSSSGGTGSVLVERTVGTAGGTLQTDDGTVSLTIPANAVAADTHFTISAVAQTPAGAVGQAFNIGPEGTTFTQPVTLALHFDAAQLAGADVNSLRLAYQEGTTWQVIQGSQPASGSAQVSGAILHLSTWGVVVADSCSIPDSVCGGCSVSCAGNTPVAECLAGAVDASPSGSSCMQPASCTCRAAEDRTACSVPDTSVCGRGCAVECSGSTPVAQCLAGAISASPQGSTCTSEPACQCVADSGGATDGGVADAGHQDGGMADAGADAGYQDGGVADAGHQDGGMADAGADAGYQDGGVADAGHQDGGVADAGADAGYQDGGMADAGADAGYQDGGMADAGADAGYQDGGAQDAGYQDGGLTDGGLPDASTDGGATDAGPADASP